MLQPRRGASIRTDASSVGKKRGAPQPIGQLIEPLVAKAPDRFEAVRRGGRVGLTAELKRRIGLLMNLLV